ncbi:chaperonin 10-like protein [Aspergillus cavernicola]|uniref:Chaperonin 10-like protein n=1 Tax=Aspergillus cavernicola TaxID=176166 RepID=A0ABR4IDX0_9EURO
MTLPPNHAAFLTSYTRRQPLRVEETEDRYPNENELVIKTAAVAINQLDWKMQDTPWTNFNYPLILGVDVAGEVIDVGSDAAAASQFSIGDRVLGHALRFATNDDRHAGFQEHTVLWANMAARIPASLSFESAAVLPLGVSTASAALFQRGTLNLPLPSLNPVKQSTTGTTTTVLVWGGTSSVGSNAVQLAVAAGCEVIATASRRNFEIVRRLGAVDVVDYSSGDVVEELIRAFEGRRLAGAFDAIGTVESLRPTLEAVSRIVGVKKVFTTADEVDEKLVPSGVKAEPIQAVDIRGEEGEDRDKTIGKKIYEDFLPQALKAGKYLIYPDPWVVGQGLDSIQAALDASKNSPGRKVVVTI